MKTLELTKEFIDNLPKTDEHIITKYQKQISNEIALNGKLIGFNKARQQANLKYGKFWRDRLESKKIYKKDHFKRISYY